jgi:shikimate kinase
MNDPRACHNIALTGFMGTGKSSVGRLVASQLGFEFLDTDTLVESRAGKSITEIFRLDGEASFRALEGEVVAELANRRQVVIATGGGLGADPSHVAQLKTHALVICLWASPEIIFNRVCHQSHRPLLQGPDPRGKIKALLAERGSAYKQADVLLDSGLRTLREVAQQIIHQYHQARHAPPHP